MMHWRRIEVSSAIHIPAEAGLERGALMKLEAAIVGKAFAPQYSIQAAIWDRATLS